MRSGRPLLAALLAGAVSFGAAPLAHAAFSGGATATSSFSAAQLSAPTQLTGTSRCTLDVLGVLVAAALDLAWAPSGTEWATGQQVVVTDAAGLTIATQQLSATATSTTVDLPLVDVGPYTATVRATYASWTSAPATTTAAAC